MSALATWFTPELNVFSRSKGASAVAKAAYRACVKLYDKYYGKVQSFGRSTRHVVTELFGDHELSLNDLWDKAEESENRKNSTIARELMIPLFSRWTDKQRQEYCELVCKMLYEEYGVAGQYSIHKPEKNDNNYHVHIMFTTREVHNGEFGKKTRILDEGLKNGEVTKLRERIAEIMNRKAEEYGSDFFVTGGKFSQYIEDHIPTLNIPHDTHPDKKEALKNENCEIENDRAKLKYFSSQLEFVEKSKVALHESKIEFEQQQELINALKKSEIEDEKPQLTVAEFKRSLLQEAFDIKEKHDLLKKATSNKKIVAKNVREINEQIKELESVKSTIVENVVHFFSGIISDDVRFFGTGKIEREKRIKELEKLKLEQSAKHKRYADIVENKENIKAYQAYICNSIYRDTIRDYEARLPDAPKDRKPAVQEIDYQKIEPVKTPAPDYSDSPFYIKNPWDSDFRP